MPFISEEIYQGYFKEFCKDESIHISKIENEDKKLIDEKLDSEFKDVLEIISFVRGYKSQNALALNSEIKKINIACTNEKEKSLQHFIDLLKTLLHINEIEFIKADDGLKLEILV